MISMEILYHLHACHPQEASRACLISAGHNPQHFPNLSPITYLNKRLQASHNCLIFFLSPVDPSPATHFPEPTYMEKLHHPSVFMKGKFLHLDCYFHLVNWGLIKLTSFQASADLFWSDNIYLNIILTHPPQSTNTYLSYILNWCCCGVVFPPPCSYVSNLHLFFPSATALAIRSISVYIFCFQHLIIHNTLNGIAVKALISQNSLIWSELGILTLCLYFFPTNKQVTLTFYNACGLCHSQEQSVIWSLPTLLF